MREILFRGKRVDGEHEWVYGNYNYHDERKKRFFKAFIGTEVMYAVIPETVGQYTGLTDKNGTKIFEGDIARVFDGEYINGVVGYSLEYGAFTIDNTSLLYLLPDVKIIGNVYDNPELLEEK